MRFIRGDSLKEAIDRFHADEALKTRPRPPLAGAAQAPAPVPRRLQRDRVRPQPRRAAPRHQAGQHHRRQARRDAGRRLGPGQGHRPGRAGRRSERTLVPSSASGSVRDPARQRPGHAGLHEPRAGRGATSSTSGPRSDVYSLGATLYCLLTGKPPLEGDDVGEVLRKVQRGEFARPRQRRPVDRRGAGGGLPQGDGASSPRTATPRPRLLAEDIERWMADEPVAAWREPASRRLPPLADAASHGGDGRRRGRAGGPRRDGGGPGRADAGQRRPEARPTPTSAIANAKVTPANADLRAANERERQRFDLAMEAIGLFHGEVSEDLLLKEKEFAGLRARLLEGGGRLLRQARAPAGGPGRPGVAGGAGPGLPRAGEADRHHRQEGRGAGRAPQGAGRAPRAGGTPGGRRRGGARRGAQPVRHGSHALGHRRLGRVGGIDRRGAQAGRGPGRRRPRRGRGPGAPGRDPGLGRREGRGSARRVRNDAPRPGDRAGARREGPRGGPIPGDPEPGAHHPRRCPRQSGPDCRGDRGLRGVRGDPPAAGRRPARGVPPPGQYGEGVPQYRPRSVGPGRPRRGDRLGAPGRGDLAEGEGGQPRRDTPGEQRGLRPQLARPVPDRERPAGRGAGGPGPGAARSSRR